MLDEDTIVNKQNRKVISFTLELSTHRTGSTVSLMQPRGLDSGIDIQMGRSCIMIVFMMSAMVMRYW